MKHVTAGGIFVSMRLVCHLQDGELRFSTPAEYSRLLEAGRALWTGDVVVSTAPGSTRSSGCHYDPPIEPELSEAVEHRVVELRVIVEGREVRGGATNYQ